jgi:hypothetical protein
VIEDRAIRRRVFDWNENVPVHTTSQSIRVP